MPAVPGALGIPDDDLATVREWVGDRQPTDADIDDAYTRHGDPLKVALALLRARLAGWLDDPAKITLEGDYSHDRTENLREIRRRIGQLEAMTGWGVQTVATGLMVRPRGR